MYYPSLFQHPFFAPTRVIVVSEERLQAAERQAKQEQLDAVKVRIEELTKYKSEIESELKNLRPGKDLDALDKEPESLEEALTGG
tara:strand:+ start:30 stop:284 length:255 start_codon:yes stop_codon:yes gene_type:complete